MTCTYTQSYIRVLYRCRHHTFISSLYNIIVPINQLPQREEAVRQIYLQRS